MTPIFIYTVLLIAFSAFYTVFVFRKEIGGKIEVHLPYILGTAILIRVLLAFVQPTGSDDYHRYIWDGKVQSVGINPYQYAPNSPELNFLHTAELPAKINFPHFKTIYFPVSQLFFYTAYIIGGDTYAGLKILLLLCELITVFCIYTMLTDLGRPKWQVLLYALSPLVLTQIMADAHIDGFGVTLLAVSLLMYTRKHFGLTAFFFALSLLVKPAALILLPFFLQSLLPDKKKAAWFIVIVAVIFSLLSGIYFQQTNMLHDLGKFANNWMFNSSFFMVFLSFTGNNQIARYICLVLLIVSLGGLYMLRAAMFEKMLYAFLLLLLFSPVVHPWYLVWLALLVSISYKQSAVLYLALASLCFVTVYQYQTNGVWKDYPAILLIEYIPVALLIGKELYSKLKNSGNKIAEA